VPLGLTSSPHSDNPLELTVIPSFLAIIHTQHPSIHLNPPWPRD
jgi:hypothetical protein